MIAYSEVSIVLHSVYACFALLIMTIAIYLVVNVIILNMSIGNRIFSIFLTLVCVFVLLGISDSKYMGNEPSIFVRIIGSMPAIFIAIILVFLVITEIILYIHLKNRQKNMLGTVEINHVQHVSFTKSCLTDAIVLIRSESIVFFRKS